MPRKPRPLSLLFVPLGARGHKELRGDGLVHIEGVNHETLCGFVDSFLPWEDVDPGTPVTCGACFRCWERCRATPKLTFKRG